MFKINYKTNFLTTFLPQNLTILSYIPLSKSIRDNIIFGKPFDKEFYKTVIKACCLDRDFRLFEYSDQTIVGERGVTLSGGQKARISLARAVYSNNDIYLLDDPLSAVDSKVGKELFQKVIKGVLKNKTVILVTHHINYAKESDTIVLLDGGQILAQGPFEEIEKAKSDIIAVFKKEDQEKERGRGDEQSEQNTLVRYLPSNKRVTTKTVSDESDSSFLIDKEQNIETEQADIVSKETYKNYIKAGRQGKLGVIILIIALLGSTFSISFYRILGYWANEQTRISHEAELNDILYEFDHTNYIIALAILLILTISFIYLRVLLIAKFNLNTNNNLHTKLVNTISGTKVSFFDKTPLGSILSRFSNDLGILDKTVWLIYYDLVSIISEVFLTIVYLCYTSRYFLIPSVLVIYICYKIKVFFTKPIITVKNIELASLNPIYSDISSTVNGLIIIRVYNQGQRFIREFKDKIILLSRMISQTTRTNRLFSMVLQFMLYLFIVIGTLIFILTCYYSEGLDSGLFGLSLYYFIVIGTGTVWMIRSFLFLDEKMQSTQRILEYHNLEQERDDGTFKDPNWPAIGRVQFQSVFMKYETADRYALNGVDFTINGGQKVGIVGRTGAGKSSILQALFRLVEIDKYKNSKIMIDGINTQNIKLFHLRKNIGIIPQTPVIFNGSIKRNLDPFEEHTEKELWDTLQEVRLKQFVEGLENKLNTDISSTSSVFSTGQKQLICLARVLLKNCKILVLDEATANVDIETDEFIQNKVKERFKNCTIVTIAHRLTTIADYDKVMVMKSGRVIEYDHAYQLLTKEIGEKDITNKEGLFASMVLKTGTKTSRNIFEIAYQSYYRSQERQQKTNEQD